MYENRDTACWWNFFFLHIQFTLFQTKNLQLPGACFFLLLLCRTENLIIQWASENVLIEIWYVFNIYCSGIGAS